MEMTRSIFYGERMKADIRVEIEMKIIRATALAASTVTTAIVARVARRNATTSAGIGITIAPTVDTMIEIHIATSTAARRVRGEGVHGIDLVRARHDQTENIINVTIGHIAQPDSPYLQPQRAMGTIVLYLE